MKPLLLALPLALAAFPALAQTSVGPIPMGQKGAPNGVMPLDGTGKAPIAQIPTGLTSTTVPTGDMLAAESVQARQNEAAASAAAFLASAGTTQAAATPVTAYTNYVTGGAAGSGVLLVTPLKNVRIINTSAVAILVYPPTGGTINGGSANAAVQLAAGGSVHVGSPDGVAWQAD